MIRHFINSDRPYNHTFAQQRFIDGASRLAKIHRNKIPCGGNILQSQLFKGLFQVHHAFPVQFDTFSDMNLICQRGFCTRQCQ